MTEQHHNRTSLLDPRSPWFTSRAVWLIPTLMWCAPLLIVVGLALGNLPLTHSPWLSWESLATVVFVGWISSLLTARFVDPTIPPDDLPGLRAFLCLAFVCGLAALLTGTVAASIDNQVNSSLNANPVYRLAYLLGVTSAGVSLGLSERFGVAQATAFAFTGGAVLGTLISNSLGPLIITTLVGAAGAVRAGVIFPDKRQFLKPAATRWKTWKHRLSWLWVWFTLILVPVAYIYLIELCLFGRGHW